MTYKLLSTGKGVIITRQPTVVKDNATFLFNDVPEGATAVFSATGATYYRHLVAGRCNIPIKNLQGNISVSITVTDKSSRIKRFICEGLKATKVGDDMLIAPDDSNLAEEFAKSKIEADELRKDFDKLRGEFENLKKQFNDMMQGYGLV